MNPKQKQFEVSRFEPEPQQLPLTWTSWSRGGQHGSGAGNWSLTHQLSSSSGSLLPPVAEMTDTPKRKNYIWMEFTGETVWWEADLKCDIASLYLKPIELFAFILQVEPEAWHQIKTWCQLNPETVGTRVPMGERLVATGTQLGHSTENNICSDHFMTKQWKWSPPAGMLLKMALYACPNIHCWHGTAT